MSEYVLEMAQIKRAFGSVPVLQGIDFKLKKAEIHALLGENGAGKSTLMNILGGVLQPDSGQISINGSKLTIPSPLAAQHQGIAFIHQELTLVNDLTIYENLFLGNELHKYGVLDVPRMCRESEKTLNRMCIDLDPRDLVSTLDASYKQIVEIARALMRNASIIIMDEPTSSLTDVEIQCVFEMMRTLRENGVSIIFISHKLTEVTAICDSYSVLRDGNMVASGATAETDEHQLAKHMVGKKLNYRDIYKPRPLGPVVLEAKNLTKAHEFHDINFQLRRGEILGFTGLLGDGRSEVMLSIFGVGDRPTGEILLDGEAVAVNNTTRAKALGIGYVPGNRKENGIIRDMSVAQNTTISILERLRSLIFLHARKEADTVLKLIGELRIKVAHMHLPITSLSGGNQQKVVLSKWLAATPKVLILDNPTQGVDIGAKLEIYAIIMQLATKGLSVIVLSSEAQEILMLCDRLYVMYHGEIRKELSRDEATLENIMIVATGGRLH